ncbi:alkyl hydroperoxide reductase [Rhodanobacter sp. FW510-R12]|uniref:peroxiredoxin family protein n=1 Tax=unclassified Rhodanobacter TaxID=2621553 RepID=UPI0007A9B251|nr:MULTISPECIES: redoxin domain-containing protein [unclassified Rhodanobacter]KZC16342.1 alkyl hydroperoxide reductase [Rhodanobacter sp. FW104-R8]KZC26404.1 alkyl hydroperoxide reductase [Rhodanobacter sp. FW510-T8]KZC30261.1 alkyl hydroperoxide reductase [Rhodanobacter sp. FW510-R10]
MTPEPAPEWRTTAWLNTPEPLNLGHFRGRMVLLHAFQMLCPGCVAHGIPQAQRVAKLFEGAPLAVVGLHTVFEHHAAMGPESLRAFLHEYRVGFPVGIDAPGPDADPIPRTMRAYAMQGTPTTILIDAQGRLRRQVFGAYDDLLLGAEIGTLLAEARQQRLEATDAAPAAGHCADGRCEADAWVSGQNPLS